RMSPLLSHSFVFLHLCLPVVHGLLANRSVTFSSSYGLARIRPFGVMVSALLLASLCASIFLDILSHFLRPHPIQRPELALAAGVMGIAFNLAIAWTSCTGRARRSGRGEGSLGISAQAAAPSCLTDICDLFPILSDEAASRSPEIEPASTGSLQSSCCLFVLALVNGKCMVGPVLVVANGLAHLLMSHDCMHGWRCNLFLYLDPIFSFLTVLVLLTLALPEVKYHGYIFLQGVPAHIHLANMGHQISQLPEVVAFHDLHVWQMVGSHLVASLHVQCCDSTSYPALIAGISAVFNNVGIQQVTIQPEFTTPAQKQMQCWLACGKACSQKLCCHNPEESEKQFKKKQESEEEPKDLIFKNIYI
uniref:Solute carrier family 30 member 1 n=1 Tax=Erpetoichthys calabaricus TaxID=27687 RepID=A0A8C4XHF5_ERPCA